MKRLIAIGALLVALSAQADPTPNSPSNLVAYVPQGPVEIQVLRVCLMWQDNSRNELAFAVERAPYDPASGGWGPWEEIAILDRNTTSWTDFDPLWGWWAAYRITALGKRSWSESNVAYYLLD